MLEYLKSLFGKSALSTRDLIGEWSCKKINNRSIDEFGFIEIRIIFNLDKTLEQQTKMNAFGGDVTTKSSGTWDLIDKQFVAEIGEHKSKCAIHKLASNIVFKPDPLFKKESINMTEYKKID